MAASIRQFVDVANSIKTNVTSVSATFANATLSGSALVVFSAFSNDNGSIAGITCTDPRGNTYTRVLDVADTSGAGDERFQIWYCPSALSLSSSQAITVSNTSTDYTEVLIYEITGLTASPFLAANGTLQTGISGSTANNLTTGNIAGGSGQVFFIGGSMNSLEGGTAPFYPSVGTGLTLGGYWFYDTLDTATTGANAYLATWGYGQFSSPGTKSYFFTSPPNASNTSFVTFGAAFAVSGSSTSVSISTTSPLTSGTIGSAYSQTLNAANGTAPYTWSIIAGALPGGLSLSSAGVISGTPTTNGTFNTTIQVTDSTGATASTAFSSTIAVASTPLSITTTSPLPAGIVAFVYSSKTFAATGGTSPYTWSIYSGAFPAGLSFSSSGVLSGTPSAAGAFSPTVKAADTTGAFVTSTFSITIAPALVITTTSPLVAATVGTPYSKTFTAANGTAPYTWSLTGGTLPTGLSLSTTGTISGTPTSASTSTSSITVTDSVSTTATASFSLTSAFSASSGTAIINWFYSGGQNGTSPVITAPTPPTGVSAVPGNTTATVSFTPPSNNGGAQVINYIITSSPGNFSATGASSPITVNGLSNGTAYTFSAVAVNSVGASTSSAASLAVTPVNTNTVPGVPTGVTALAGSSQATVSFATPTSNGGSAITSYTATSTPGGFFTSGATSPLIVSGLSNGTAYTFSVTATNSVGTGSPSTSSNSVTPSASTNLAMYIGTSAGINQSLWPPSDNYSSGQVYNNTTNLQSGHIQNVAVTGQYSYWQQATNWATVEDGGLNGVNIAPYTYLMMDIYPTTSNQINGMGWHYTRSTGDDLGMNVNFYSGAFTTTTGRTLTANTWNTGVKIPLYAVAGLSQYNYYKWLIQVSTGTVLFDNVYFVPGNVGWIYRGRPNLESGWIEASSNLSTDYTVLVNGVLSGGTEAAPNSNSNAWFAANSPPDPATLFTGSISGTTLTVTAVQSGTIAIGQTVVYDGSPVVCRIISGSGTTWTLNASTTAASQSMTSVVCQFNVCSAKVISTAVNPVWAVNYAGGYNISSYLNFTFATGPTKTGYGYQVQFYNTSGVAVGSAVTMTTPSDGGVVTTPTGVWTIWNSLLSAFNLGTTIIGGVSIKETSTNSTNVFYISAIGFWS